jgi:GT2 family glycosyltransferase
MNPVNPTQEPAVDVVIVCYRSRDLIAKCLDSVFHQTRVVPKVVVIENASGDGVATSLEPFQDKLTFIENSENVGFGRACNQGAALGKAPFILFLNPDCVVTDGTLSELIEFLAHSPAVALAGPKVLEPGGEVRPYSDYPCPPLVPAHLKKLPGAITSIVGACMIVRREAFEAVSGFDPSFPLYAEETDLCLRLRVAGWEIGHDPKTTVHHEDGASERGASSYDVERRKRRALLQFMMKHYDRQAVRKWARRELAKTRFKTSLTRAGCRLLGSQAELPAKIQKYRATADAITEAFGP